MRFYDSDQLLHHSRFFDALSVDVRLVALFYRVITQFERCTLNETCFSSIKDVMVNVMNMRHAIPAVVLIFVSVVPANSQDAVSAGPSPTLAPQSSNLLSPSPTPATDPTKLEAADALWAKIETQTKSIDNSFTTAGKIPQLQLVLDSLNEFVAQYPGDSRYWRARLDIVDRSREMANLSGTLIDRKEEDTKLQEIVSTQNVPKDVAAEADYLLIRDQIRRIVLSLPITDDGWSQIEKLNSGYEANFQDTAIGRTKGGLLWRSELTMLNRAGNRTRYDSLVQRLQADPLPEMQEIAKTGSRMEALKTKPLDIRFTAQDGTPVDLANFKGRVVLIDFWATWCGPCVREVPNVLAVYNKYHDRGFEVIGISLDRDEARLVNFTKSHGMVWPQYFDGRAWDNGISKPLGINLIPAMWLIDKNGLLSTTNGRQNLDGQVARLLDGNVAGAIASPPNTTNPSPTDSQTNAIKSPAASSAVFD